MKRELSVNEEHSLSLQTVKSPLRYPGGKSKAVKSILPYIPKGTRKLCSPFLGGASIELACASRGIAVFGSDLFAPLIDFWTVLLENRSALASCIQKYYPLSKHQFYQLQKTFPTLENQLSRAAAFYVLNRCSFSGATLSGGLSPSHPRFTQRAIDKLKAFQVSHFQVAHLDYQEAITKHSDTLLYLDPPYYNGQALYGNRGDMHKHFKHEELQSMLLSRDRWILSYNDCEKVRSLYRDFKSVHPTWKYGMSKDKRSKEVLILSDDIARYHDKER